MVSMKTRNKFAKALADPRYRQRVKARTKDRQVDDKHQYDNQIREYWEEKKYDRDDR